MFMGCSVMFYAQNKEEKADAYFADFKFDKAITLYQELVNDRKRPSLNTIQKLADSYFNLSNYQDASKWYERLYSIEGSQIGEGNFIKLVQSLKASHQMNRADRLLHEYYEDEDRLQMILAQKAHLDSLLNEKEIFTVNNMGFNSKKSDFAPMPYKGGLIFASARDTIKSNGELYPWNKQPYLDMYLTQPEYSNFIPEKFLNNLESSFHDATITFSWDGETVFFTRNYLKNKKKLSANQEGLSNMQILKGRIYKNQLVDVTSLSFNSKNYSCGHPMITPDGRYLYFTSNMPGGYGESDIYRVEISRQGEVLSDPINLGETINTKGREMFPFVEDGVLYFSSDSHYGLGGLDVFASTIYSNTQYSVPFNMGKPINSNMDDFSFVRGKKKSGGYFASNRSGGMGDDDIYSFEKAKAVDCLEYAGYVLDKQTGEPIADANVELKNLTDELMTVFRTDASGYYHLNLPCNKKNAIAFTKAGYSNELVEIETFENPQAASLDNNIYLTKFSNIVKKEGEVEKIIVNPIYFEYDKWNITTRAELELAKVLFAMTQFPDIKIKIESHTDARGSDDYNLLLSDKRAKSTQKYLISQGIAPERIESAYGFGEYKLINECANGVACSDQKHLENRRSDFIIVSKNANTELTK